MNVPENPSPVGRRVDVEAARGWISHQFSGMSVLLERIASSLEKFDEARVLVPPGYDGDLVLNNSGRLIFQDDSDEVARQLFRHLHELGGRTVIVQDELSRRAYAPADAFYVDEAVFRSVALLEDPDNGVDLLRTGSSGYPCDAIICSMSEADLELVNGSVLRQETIDKVAECTIAVLTSVWDDESYVVMWREA